MNAARKYDILGGHNEYELPIPRNIAEEIRTDPFGLGNNVKGLTTLNHKQKLHNYSEELVSTYGRFDGEHYTLSLSSLPDDEQNELARLYIESSGRETSECVYGHDFSIENEYTCALLSMLKCNSRENREKFAEVTQKNIIDYYANSLQEILDDACIGYLQNTMNENGFHSEQDLEYGDFHWRLF